MCRSKRNWAMIIIFICLGLLFWGCSQSSEGNSNTENRTNNINNNEENVDEVTLEEWDDNGEPVTVKVLYPWGEDNFESDIVEKFQDEIPKNITLECVCTAAQLESLEEMNANEITPDIMFANWGIDDLVELGMLEPIDDYVEKYGVDLSEFDESVIATYRAMDPDGEGQLIGLPTFVDTVGLFYNKEIFDLFGVSYPDPENPMTWSEVLDLAVQMTEERNGVQYYGLEMGAGLTTEEATFPLREFGINLTDPDTGNVLISESPEFKQYVEFMDKLYSIPGLYDPSDEAREIDRFAEKSAAMNISWPGYLRWGLGGDPKDVENVGVAPIPVWEEGGKGPQLYAHPYVLNKYGENKDAGFQVMLAIAKVDAMDPLTSPYTEFSPNSNNENYPLYEEKNMKVFWNYEGAIPPKKISKWDDYVDVEGSLPRLGEGNMDINEFLRVLKEESEIKIKETKLK